MQLLESSSSLIEFGAASLTPTLCSVGDASLCLTYTTTTSEELWLDAIIGRVTTNLEVGTDVFGIALDWEYDGDACGSRTLTLVIDGAPPLMWQLSDDTMIAGRVTPGADGRQYASLSYSGRGQSLSCELVEGSSSAHQLLNRAPTTKIIILPKPTCPDDFRGVCR